MKRLILAFAVALAFTACVSPAYDTAALITPTCPGYKHEYQCQSWAISFRQGMKLQGYPVTLVYFDVSGRGKTFRHVAAAWFDKDGWWMQDNFYGPMQVDSFNRYSWLTRVENFVSPMPVGGAEVMPSGIGAANIRVIVP